VRRTKDLFPTLIGEEQFPPDSPVFRFRTGGAGGVIFRPLPFPLMKRGRVLRGPESALPIPARRKRSPPSCGERRAFVASSRLAGMRSPGRKSPRVHEGAELVAKLDVQGKRDSVAGDGVEALSLTFGQFYQILAWCKSQFVSAPRPLRLAEHQPVHASAHIPEVGFRRLP